MPRYRLYNKLNFNQTATYLSITYIVHYNLVLHFMQKLLVHIAMLTMPLILCGQNAWTLDFCIEQALNNNISIQKSRIDQNVSEVSLKQQRGGYQPSVSFSSGHNYTHTPFPTLGYGYSTSGGGLEADNAVKHHSYSGNIGINLNWTIWNGSRQPQIEQARINLRRAGLITNQMENDIREQVVQVYTQLLYATENVNVRQAMVESSEALRAQGEERLKVGTINKSAYLQLIAQCASDTASLTQAQADMQNQQLALLQLMELPAGTIFTLTDETDAERIALTEVPLLTEVYDNALSNRPEIRAAILNQDAAQYDVKIAKAGYMPSLGLSAGTGTGWRTGTDFTFAEQMKNGWSNTAGINISVPIWNGRQTKSQVERAKWQEMQSALTYQEQIKSLRKAVETIWLNATTSQQQYRSALARLDAVKEAYDILQEQFRIGQKTPTDIMQQRAELISAEQQTLQAKYNAYYAQLMLRYYSEGL